MTSLSYAGRNPSWAEYEKSSPCDRRAIERRWREIANSPLTWANTAGAERTGRDQADANWHRAMFGEKRFSKTWDDDRSGIMEGHGPLTGTDYGL